MIHTDIVQVRRHDPTITTSRLFSPKQKKTKKMFYLYGVWVRSIVTELLRTLMEMMKPGYIIKLLVILSRIFIYP